MKKLLIVSLLLLGSQAFADVRSDIDLVGKVYISCTPGYRIPDGLQKGKALGSFRNPEFKKGEEEGLAPRCKIFKVKLAK